MQPLSHDTSSRPRRTALAFSVLALACVGCLLPFVNKAFHIDDPLFLWAARQIQRRPLDFYGFEVNWYGTTMPMAEVMKNPPLASYYLALAAAIVGWSEPALHLMFLPAALGVVWGTYRLAEGLCSRPLGAALAALLSPVFLVSSTNVMCDTLTLCFWVWAVVFWDRGLRRGNGLILVWAALLITLCALTKYTGLCLVPLLLAYTLARACTTGQTWRTTAKALAALALPAVSLGAYELLTRAAYGHGLIFDAFRSSGGYAAAGAKPIRLEYRNDGLVIALAFLGGGVSAALCYVPLLWTRRQLLIGVAAAAALAVIDFLYEGTMGVNFGYFSPTVAQFLLYSTGGYAVLALAALDLGQHHDAPALLLFLWVAGVWVFAGALTGTVSGRYLLPLLPAASILLMRRLDKRFGVAPSLLAWRWGWPLAPAGVLALLVAWADYRLADTARIAADVLAARRRALSGSLHFGGHWGFQYYMQQHGAIPLDRTKSDIHPGDLVVLPGNNTCVRVLKDRDRYQMVPELQVEEASCPWLATMDAKVGAGFYAAGWGPLPFAFGRAAPERYQVVQLPDDPPEPDRKDARQ